jgi:anti-sigma factor RsiW
MTRPFDPALLDQLSAYLDGALSAEDALAIERLVETDPAVAAEFEALSRVDQAARTGFDSLLTDPIPVALGRVIAQTVDRTPVAKLPPLMPANIPGPPIWRSVAAALALLLIGGATGAYFTRAAAPVQVASAMGWLDQVADYHLVYATQKRHLVEVPASETAHLQKWLTDTTGVAFTVPDLAASGLTFQGARLLVASGKPVAQLMYTDAAGQVVALCFLAGGDANAGAGTTPLQSRNAKGVNMVWWTSKDASYVVVGPSTGVDLQSVAKAASTVL